MDVDPTNYGAIGAIGGGVVAVMVIAGKLWTIISKMRVETSADNSHLVVLQTMQTEINRLARQLNEEREYAERQLLRERERCEVEMKRLGAEIAGLRSRIVALEGSSD